MQDFSTIITTSKSPAEVFDAVNNVPGWWNTNFTGASTQLNDEFEVRFGDVHYSRQRLTEVIPAKKVEWLVTDSRLTFLKDMEEWTGTKVIFDIAEKDGQTQLRLTHVGLNPSVECYDACSPAWGQYMHNSLLCLINKGKGQPGFPPANPCE